MKTYGTQLQNYEERSVAVAVIVTQNDKYVLRRDTDDGYIQFVRGGIEEGESGQDAVIREVKEETGYVDIASVEAIDYEYAVFESFQDVKRKSICYPFLVRLVSNTKIERNLDEHEFADYQLIEYTHQELLLKHKELNIADHTRDLMLFTIKTNKLIF